MVSKIIAEIDLLISNDASFLNKKVKYFQDLNFSANLAVVLSHPLPEPSDDGFLLSARHNHRIYAHSRHRVTHTRWTLKHNIRKLKQCLSGKSFSQSLIFK